jgi:hypothetical protein
MPARRLGVLESNSSVVAKKWPKLLVGAANGAAGKTSDF